MGVMPSPSGEGVCGPDHRRMRGKLAVLIRLRAAAGRLPLIRRCGATFSLRAKSRLRRLRSDTRLRAQPRGGSLLGQYRIILSADTASEVRQLLSQKRR